MAEALITPEVLRWARERAAMPVDTLAEKLGTGVDKVEAWEEGTARPSFKQAEKIADIVHIPFGYLFLPEPPVEQLPIPDLRSALPGVPRHGFSADFLDLVRDVLFKQDWYREYLVNHGAGPLPFVGKFTLSEPIEIVAADIRMMLQIDPGVTMSGSWEQHLSYLFNRCEEIGIWVMRTGHVGTNTHRTLNISDFRGFAIADEVAPLIVINIRDAKAAQVFTLAHELAHIWLGQSGISDPFQERESDNDADGIEQRCNAIAAEVLVPRTRFLELWDNSLGLSINAGILARRFKVSSVVIARRALEIGGISWAQYWDFFNQERKSWQTAPEKSGGDFFRNLPVKNGKNFTRAVLASAMSGDTPLREAGALLHTKPVNVRKLYNKQILER